MNDAPLIPESDLPFPLPQTKPRVLGIGNKDGRVMLVIDGKIFGAFLPAQAAVLAAKIIAQCAIITCGYNPDMVTEEADKIAKETPPADNPQN